jgi:hypothetical protein
MSAAVLNQLLRAPGEIAERCRQDKDIRPIALTSLGSIAAGAAAFGAVLGSFRGGVQIAYGAVKVPLAVLATLALCAPAFHALAAVLGRPRPMRAVITLTLAAAGRSSLVLLAFTPALWLALDCGVGYHSAAVLAALAYGVAGLAALGVIIRGIGQGDGRLLTALAFMAMFFATGGQTAWILRPYLVRPKAVTVPFLRAREGGFSDAVLRSSRSAAGIYDSETSDFSEVERPKQASDPRKPVYEGKSDHAREMEEATPSSARARAEEARAPSSARARDEDNAARARDEGSSMPPSTRARGEDDAPSSIRARGEEDDL